MRNDLMRKFDFKLMYKVTISNDIMNKILYIILMYIIYLAKRQAL